MRADCDVAIRHGRITDDFRIRALLPTLRFILRRGGFVRIVSYLGRPGGRVHEELSMRPIARRLAQLLNRKVVFIANPFDSAVRRRLRDTNQILFFENIRFWPEEEKNDPKFARAFAQWGDIFVNEAFANTHRAHALVVAITRFLPSFAGLQLMREIEALAHIHRNPKRPFVAIVGGAKIETKLPLIWKFLHEADHVLIGGALANTIFAYQKKDVGASVIDHHVYAALGKGKFLKNKKLILPSDLVIAPSLHADAPIHVIATGQPVNQDEYIVDIGPKSQKQFTAILKDAKTVVWNGPLGLAEIRQFAGGTKTIAHFLRTLKAFKMVGGGDTVAILNRYNLLKGFSHVSTGGGAMLEYLAGKKLPGIEALKRRN